MGSSEKFVQRIIFHFSASLHSVGDIGPRFAVRFTERLTLSQKGKAKRNAK